MRLYIDTGVFIDYLNQRGFGGMGLRSANRRGRTPQQIFADAEQVLIRIRQRHQAATSTLTCYEAEEALFKQLRAATRGVSQASTLIVPIARSFVVQTMVAIELFNVTLLDLTIATIERQLGETTLQRRGIRAADALHVATAIAFDADVILTVDDDMLGLNHQLVNLSSRPIRCCDTDEALTFL